MAFATVLRHDILLTFIVSQILPHFRGDCEHGRMVGLRVSLCSRCGTLIIIARVRHASPRWQRVLSLAIFSFTFLPHHPLPLVRLALECRFDVTMIKPAEVWPEQAHSRLPPQRGETQGFADSRKASARRGCNSAVRTICWSKDGRTSFNVGGRGRTSNCLC